MKIIYRAGIDPPNIQEGKLKLSYMASGTRLKVSIDGYIIDEPEEEETYRWFDTFKEAKQWIEDYYQQKITEHENEILWADEELRKAEALHED